MKLATAQPASFQKKLMLLLFQKKLMCQVMQTTLGWAAGAIADLSLGNF
jgi:hypothetical protein